MQDKNHTLFFIKNTQSQMLHDRGFIIPEAEQQLVELDNHEFQQFMNARSTETKQTVRSLLSQKYVHQSEPRIALVYYGTTYGKPHLSKAVVDNFIAEAQRVMATDAILIAEELPSASAMKEISAVITFKIQIFLDSELMYNVVNHEYVPRHKLLSVTKQAQLLEKMKIKLSQLSQIMHYDPVIKYYGWPRGRIVKIYRVDDVIAVMNKNSINYRVIV